MKTTWLLRNICIVPACLFVVGTSYLLLFLPGLSGEEILLAGGGRISAKVVKRTEEKIFVDIGFTVLGIPLKEVREVIEETRTEDAGDGGAGSSGGEREESIFFTASLESGTVKEKAEWISEAVVQVECPGKLGSGFVINDREGYVVTNYHVVEGRQDISVVIYERNGKELRRIKLSEVRIVALNPFFDLALLKIEKLIPEEGGSGGPVKLKKVYLGDSSQVRPGDPVFAIGSPLGLERSVSEGIVSNNRRAIGGLLYVQTTAAINPGNSGGPLFNNRGEVVGITSLKAWGESLGFAIPVNSLKNFLKNREAFAFDKDNANTGVRYYKPPRKAHSGNAEKMKSGRF